MFVDNNNYMQRKSICFDWCSTEFNGILGKMFSVIFSGCRGANSMRSENNN